MQMRRFANVEADQVRRQCFRNVRTMQTTLVHQAACRTKEKLQQATRLEARHLMKPMKFSNHLRGLIEFRNTSQASVAERAGISTAVMSRLVNGEREPNMDHAVAISAALEITVDELLRHTTAGHIAGKWVPMDAYAKLEHKVVQACRERDILQAQLNSEIARNESMRSSLWESEQRNAKLHIDIGELRAERASLREYESKHE
jgi:transcriptional regulator with XRE-family HTH domain